MEEHYEKRIETIEKQFEHLKKKKEEDEKELKVFFDTWDKISNKHNRN